MTTSSKILDLDPTSLDGNKFCDSSNVNIHMLIFKTRSTIRIKAFSDITRESEYVFRH